MSPALNAYATPGVAEKRTRDTFRPFVHSALDDFDLTLVESRIYARISRRANGEGVENRCNESVVNMGKRLRLSPDRVTASIKALEGYRMILRHKRPGKTNEFSTTPRTEWMRKTEKRGHEVLRLVPKKAATDGLHTLLIPAKLDDFGLSLIEFRLYMRLVRRAGNGRCWEHLPSAAKRLGVKVRSVQYALGVLTGCEMITRHARNGKRDEFSITLPSEWKASELAIMREHMRDMHVRTKLRAKDKLSKKELEGGACTGVGVVHVQGHEGSPLKVVLDSSDSKANHLRSIRPPLRAFAKSAHVLAPPKGGVSEFLRNGNAYGELTTMEDVYPTMSVSTGG